MKSILLIIDVQRGFVVEGANDNVITKIDQLLEDEVFDCVISSIYKNSPDNNIVKLMGWTKMMSAAECALIGAATTKSDYLIDKSQYSAYTEDLLAILSKVNGGKMPEAIYIVGFDTECCILKTAVDFFEQGIRPIVLSQYCGASGGEDAHIAGIRSLESLIGRNNIYNNNIHTQEDLHKAFTQATTASYIPSCSTYMKAKQVVELLAQKGWHISLAESCTGGMATAGIVDIASASKVLNVSHVTYANSAKKRYLGVSDESIAIYGAVSEIVAKEMAIGAATANGAEVGVGISGIAGPGGTTASKEVGTVCFGFYIYGKTHTFTQYFGDIGRYAVRKASVLFVYQTLIELLSKE